MDAPSSRKWILLAVSALLLLALASGLRSCFTGGKSAPAAETSLALPDLLGDTDSGFLKVRGPRPFRFPADHGPHPEYRSEWWYFTGNLKAAEGGEFGYQLTFFRSGLRPPGGDALAGGKRTSTWAAGDAYMAHFALTDAAGGTFEAHERFSRGALGLAGARSGVDGPFRVWLEDWSAASVDDPATPVDKPATPVDHPATPVDIDSTTEDSSSQGRSGEASIFPLRLRAAQGSIAIDLVLEAGKPAVLQGDRGYSRKGPEEGNASFYYSHTRMPSSGQVTISAGTFRVSGASWMDREWGSSILTPGLAGWEWFGLQLADSTDWLFFRLRKAGPAAAAEDSVDFDYGIKVDARGGTRLLGRADLSARILSRWTGSGGAAYPSRWLIRVPSESLEMEVAPVLAGQELALSVPYWEGAVRVQARRDGQALSGQGYMELTGYR